MKCMIHASGSRRARRVLEHDQVDAHGGGRTRRMRADRIAEDLGHIAPC
jgi:hypothetical protein